MYDPDEAVKRLGERLQDLKALRAAVLSRASVTSSKAQAVDELDRLIAEADHELSSLHLQQLKKLSTRE